MWTFILFSVALIIEIIFQTWVFVYTRIIYEDEKHDKEDYKEY